MLETLLLVITFVASFAVTGAVRGHAVRHELVDVPDARSSHFRPTPHGGGLSIAIAFFGASVILFLTGAMPLTLFMALFGGGLAVAVIGFLDDHTSLPVPIRIMVHFAAAAWALYWLGGSPSVSVGDNTWDLGWPGDVIGAVAIVWLLNLYNFMDGIDGIAAVEAITVAAAACLILMAGESDRSVPWFSLLAAATLGFLPWNWPPAHIFMGDIGSGFLGFTLGILALYTAHEGTLSIWTWAILLGVFIVDATATLLRRMIAGERWYQAHRSHAYQHAAIRWGSHRRVTLAALAINIVWLTPLAWFVTRHPEWGLIATGVALTPLIVLALKLGAGQNS